MNAIAIILGLAAAALGTAGALLLKKAAATFSWKKPINISLILAGVLYISSTIPFMFALKYTDLSFIYPFTSLHYFFASMMGAVVYHEKLNKKKIIGIILIIAGIVLTGIGK